MIVQRPLIKRDRIKFKMASADLQKLINTRKNI